MEFTLILRDVPFSLDYTLDSGQVFRWEKRGEWWYGVVSDAVIKLRKEGDSLHCFSSNDKIEASFIKRYFKLDVDLKAILSTIMKDHHVISAIQRFYGLRLIRQDMWECLISFILATNSNIQAIKRMISNLCNRFGRRIKFEGLDYYTFPGAEALSAASIEELRECGLGYRASYVKVVSERIHFGDFELSELAINDYEHAKKRLMDKLFGEKLLKGVGPKVADCFLLFSCEKDEAFPIDVWIARAVVHYYPNLIDEEVRLKLERGGIKLTSKEYESISSSLRSYFGKYAGYAQQYLYMLSRFELGSRSYRS